MKLAALSGANDFAILTNTQAISAVRTPIVIHSGATLSRFSPRSRVMHRYGGFDAWGIYVDSFPVHFTGCRLVDFCSKVEWLSSGN